MFNSSKQDSLHIRGSECPDCNNLILSVEKYKQGQGKVEEQVIWPISSGRLPAPPDVPENIAQDFNEACVVLPFSAKASAALSRRCLQTLLQEAAETTSTNLNRQIDEALPSLPSYIAENLDAVRWIGNFAAHEQKSKTTGVILDVEPGEAEWNLDILETLFDFYYVRPELERKKREEINRKLTDAGKPTLKAP